MERTIGDRKVGAVGLGLMRLTWNPKAPSIEQAIEVMKAAVENGSTFFNGGEFYGPDYSNLKLIAAYFKKYPEDRPKVFISIKGALNLQTFAPASTPDEIRSSVLNIVKQLDGVHMDLFEPARIPSMEIEETMKTCLELQKEGLFTYIGLSEPSAATVERAVKVGPVAAVETEFSLFTTDIEENGLLATCEKLNIPLIAYSPVMRGMLTGKIQRPEDIPEGDFRQTLPRFQGENFYHNLALVEKVKEIAEKSQLTSTQVAIGWVLKQSKLIIALPGSTTIEQATQNAESGKQEVSDEDDKQLRAILAKLGIKGDRYNSHMMQVVAK